MRFEFVDTDTVVSRSKQLQGHLRGDPYEAYRYEAYIDVEAADLQSALAAADCRLTVLSETDAGHLEEIMLFPVLPLQFEIRFRGGSACAESLRSDRRAVRLAAESRACSPADALRDLRARSIEPVTVDAARR